MPALKAGFFTSGFIEWKRYRLDDEGFDLGSQKICKA